MEMASEFGGWPLTMTFKLWISVVRNNFRLFRKNYAFTMAASEFADGLRARSCLIDPDG